MHMLHLAFGTMYLHLKRQANIVVLECHEKVEGVIKSRKSKKDMQ